MPDIILKRPNFVVADLDRALALYRDILGFSVTFIKTSDKSSYSYPTFAFGKSADLRFAILSTPTQPEIFALTELKGQPLPEPRAPRDHALVLKAADYDGLRQKLKDGGYRLLEEGRLQTHAGASGREQAFLDADGHTVLIYKLDESK